MMRSISLNQTLESERDGIEINGSSRSAAVCEIPLASVRIFSTVRMSFSVSFAALAGFASIDKKEGAAGLEVRFLAMENSKKVRWFLENTS